LHNYGKVWYSSVDIDFIDSQFSTSRKQVETRKEKLTCKKEK
jgi:hypothetical protein